MDSTHRDNAPFFLKNEDLMTQVAGYEVVDGAAGPGSVPIDAKQVYTLSVGPRSGEEVSANFLAGKRAPTISEFVYAKKRFKDEKNDIVEHRSNLTKAHISAGDGFHLRIDSARVVEASSSLPYPVAVAINGFEHDLLTDNGGACFVLHGGETKANIELAPKTSFEGLEDFSVGIASEYNFNRRKERTDDGGVLVPSINYPLLSSGDDPVSYKKETYETDVKEFMEDRARYVSRGTIVPNKDVVRVFPIGAKTFNAEHMRTTGGMNAHGTVTLVLETTYYALDANEAIDSVL